MSEDSSAAPPPAPAPSGPASAAAARERPPWLVSIRRSRSELPVGAGLLVTPRHVLTCAHVVRAGTALGVPEEPVFVEFQYAEAHDPLPATVVPGGWHPAAGAETGDVAVLELGAPAPPEAVPAPLRTTDSGTWGHQFRAYGYPREHPRQGVPVRGEIIGHAGSEWLQVEASPHSGWSLEQGFSGSPVWDVNSGGVVGMLVARDSVAKIDRRTAYAIRVETLVRYWPELGAYVRGATTRELRERLESLLWLPLTEDGEIPRVDQVDPHDIGVSRSKYSDHPEHSPYVPRRPQDGLLDAALAESRFVLLAGRSKAGKSRTLYEALLRTMPGARLVVPRPDGTDRRILDDLSRLGLPSGQDRAVLWLDDLHRYLRPGGLDLQTLDRLARRHPAVTVVATIPAKQRAALTAMENDLGRVARTVLGKAYTVELPPLLGPEDAAVARELYPREDFAGRGIGEHMVAAPGVEQRYEDGADSCPEGWALVKAVTDWHRMGMTGPVPEPVLLDLFRAYMSEHHPQFVPDEALYRTGLAWAREPVVGAVALVYQVPGPDDVPAYTGFPYTSEYLDTRADDPSAPVPRFAWDYLADCRTATELLPIAYTALVREEADVAELLLRRIAGSPEDRDGSAWASLMLGQIRLVLGDFDAAVELLDAAASSGSEDVAPLAQVELASALVMTGDRSRARGLLERALGSADPQVSQLAQVGLARVLVMEGDTEQAEQLLEAVIASGDMEAEPLATAQLVRSLTEGDRAGVRTGREPGTELGKPGAGMGISRGLGSAPPVERPWALTRMVGEDVAAQITSLARANLGGVLVHQGKLERAEALLRSVIDSGMTHIVPWAQSDLGALLSEQERYEEARELLEAAIDSGHPLVFPTAQVTLAIVLLGLGDEEQGLAVLEEAVAAGHPSQGLRAACALGEWHTELGDPDLAEEWLELVTTTDHPDWSPPARIALAVLLARQEPDEADESDESDGGQEGAADGVARARELLVDVIGSGHPHQGPRAAAVLGDLLVREELPAEAEDAYRIAIDSGHWHWSPPARIALGVLLSGQEGGAARARELLTGVIDSGHPHQGPRAADLLGDLLVREGLLEEAEDAYRIAIDSRHPHWSLIARYDLAVMLADREDYERAENLLRELADDDDVTAATWGRALLGMVIIGSGRRSEGIAHLRAAGDAGVHPASPMARFQLAKCLIEDGDDDGAAELLRAVLQDEPSDVTEAARASLCVLLLRQDDREAAEELLMGVEDSGDPGAIALAYLGMGEFLLDVGEVSAAGDLLETALGIGDPETAPRAGALLGVVRRSMADGGSAEARGLLEQARSLLTAALASAADDPTVEPLARRYLGSTQFRLGLYADAERTLLPLARSDDAQHRPQALLLLAQVLAVGERPVEAYPWFEEAIACGDPDTESQARRLYCELLVSAGLLEQAGAVLAPQDAPPPPEPQSPPPALPPPPSHGLPPEVLKLLGDVASAEGDPEEARYWYTRARAR
ncbi:tetratricopeptide repeat protein [Streptomyces sp. NPDC048340]|uniref:tetratricopeptide repeat protein n=1 Tax=Streptomyces sp. NPDC048340 TaxID=3365537 RepID=UPI00372129D1